jgi:5,10-methylenetetrahydromethanopterin reductase
MTVDHVVLAEELGFQRAWLYDSPAVYLDLWAVMALAATRTSRIGLASGILVPALRHPVVTASALATIESLAPGRVTAGIGTGFSGRMLLGKPAMKWKDVEEYVAVVRGLLIGEEGIWDGELVTMCHPAGFATARPFRVPIVIAADGPVGAAVAHRVGDGIFTTHMDAGNDFDWNVRMLFGTVLDDAESPISDRVFDAVGPSAALSYHALYARGGPEAVAKLPNGASWARAVERIAPERRHFAVHQGHVVEVNPIDRVHVPREFVAKRTFTGSAAELAGRLDALAAKGVTEVAYQPVGRDIARELTAFAKMAGI